MRLTLVLLTVAAIHVTAKGLAQKINLSEKHVSIEKVMRKIQQQSGCDFFYKRSTLQLAKPVSINLKSGTLKEALSLCFKDQPDLTYSMVDNVVIVKKRVMASGQGSYFNIAPMVKIQVPIELPVHGKITDTLGRPIAGVTITILGSRKGVFSDENGNYQIETKPGDKLSFSYVGYNNKILIVGRENELNVQLVQLVSSLNDLVIVGYGKQQKELVTGAVSTIKMDNVLGDRPVTSLGALLQGATPGLQVSISSGQPGAGSSWNIRGGTDFGSSLTSGISTQGPFILVDNVPYTGPTNLLDPNDIESVTVLKDAGSAAIYGARSAFGVVLITTKSGKKNQKVQFNYSDNFVISRPVNLPVKATPKQQVQAWIDGGMTAAYNGGQNLTTWMGLLDDYQKNPQNYRGGSAIDNGIYYQLAATDAVKELLGNSAFQQMHNFSVSGGSDKTTYRLSLGLTNENGILVPRANQDNFKRYNIKSDVSSDVTPWLNLQLDAAYNNSTTLSPVYTNAFGDATNTPSALPLDSIPGIASAKNEIEATVPVTNAYDDIRITGRAVAKIVKDLTITGDYTIDNNHNLVTTYNKKVGGFLNPYGYTEQTIGSDAYTKSNATTKFSSINIYGTYIKSISNNNFTVTAGFNQEQSNSEAESITASGMLNPDLPFISGVTGLIPYQASDSYSDYAVRGIFGRINYDYKNKYLVQLNGRFDGSSKFPQGHRWGFFPSTSVGWRIMQEPFMKSLKPYINELKLRASFGSVGNQNIASYQYIPGMSVNIPNWLYNSAKVGSLNPPGLISTTFTWETVQTKDAGIDIGLWKNRLTATFDWYQRDTKNILTSNANPVPATLGTGAPLQNAGALSTKGFELQLTWRDKIGQVGYYVTASLYNYNSIVTKVNNPQSVVTGNTLYVGKHIGEIWGYTSNGFYTADDFVAGSLNSNLRGGTLLAGIARQNGQAPNPGDIMYKDFDTSGTITSGAGTLGNSGDLKVIGNSTPQYQYGISGGVSYKEFDFSFIITGVGKQQQFINNTLTFPNQWLTYGALYANELNYWTPTNTSAYYGRIYTDNVNSPYQSYNQITQTKFLLNGAFLRIQNLTLRYSLPNKLIRKTRITKAQVFVSVENPYTFTHMPKGMYPDVSTQGATAGGGLGYPYMHKTSFGINLSF
ncbi:TonB-dependent receptor [Arachidicoccus sp.]|uniref:TonB-dependent receptor n=1 Tax=Arachidicoccus sp. TaxID=1872624 RepID=UPI003D1FB03F